MTTQVVTASSAIDMLGPYLASRAVCPFCQHENTLVHLEGPGSSVKPVDVCAHIKAHLCDEDGNSEYEFAS
jgi:hypothetical protein